MPTSSPGFMAIGLVELVIFIGGIPLAIWWLWRRRDWVEQQRRSNNPKLQALVRAALVTFLAFAALIVLIAFPGARWGTGLGALALGIWWLVTRKSRRHKRERARWLSNNAAAIGKFGQDQEGRAAKIDEIFDAKLATIEFKLDELKDYWIKADIGRALSAMPPKEREALRAGYHLYNFGMLKEHDFYYLRLAVVFADGNGSVIDWKQNAKSSKTVNESIANYQGPRKLDAMISQILSVLTKRPSTASDPPALKKLSARLLGDGGDLVPGAPLKSAAKGAPVEAGLILGLDEKAPDTWWYYDGEGSLITIAPPGSGKTQCQVFPNLLMWKGAAVVLDVKGEIYEQTSKWRRENVGPVYKFSPLDPATSHGYNPLAEVRADPDYLWEDARFLADMMIVPSGAKDPFWEHRARDVLTAAIARVCIEQDIAKRSMGDVLDILHGVGWDKFVAYLEARVDFASMTRAGHSLGSMEPKTRDGVLQSALSSMSAWDGERIARATRKSDWSPLDLRGGKNPTIYICLKPNEVDSYISVLRVFIAQHIRSLTSTKVPAHGVQPILFILDELPRLRHMPPVEEALEIGRQYGIKLWLFAQSLGQLKEAYPNADGMIGGCAIRMFMNPSLHDETAQKVSDDIGFMDSVIDGTRVKVVEPNVLSGPDYMDLVIVMAVNARAARLRKYFAYEDDALKARMGALRPAQSLPA
jgi:type IV secretion system protein VirD4